MAFAQGSRSRLSYLAESTFGTTPAGNFQEIPFVTHSLDLVKDRVQSGTITSHGMPVHDRHGNRQVQGDIVCELRADEYDDFLKSVMQSTWDTSPSSAPDELKVGNTPVYFSIEDYQQDIDQAKIFTGCMVSTMEISIRPNQMINTTFGIVGKNMSITATQKTATAPTLNDPFDAYSGLITLGDQGGALSSITNVLGVDFTISRGLTPTFVVGASTTPEIVKESLCTVEGTIDVFFEDTALINRFLNETDTAFDFEVDDPSGANEYKFFFPHVKFNGASTPVTGPSSRIMKIPFVSLYDATEASNLVIYRPETA